MALDWSFEPNPALKGSYYRRLEDIPLALAKFEVTTLPANSHAQFIAYYLGVEKLAKAIQRSISEERLSPERQSRGHQICRAQI